MSSPRPTEPYHFQANLIWWDSPFKAVWQVVKKQTEYILYSVKSIPIQHFFPQQADWVAAQGQAQGLPSERTALIVWTYFLCVGFTNHGRKETISLSAASPRPVVLQWGISNAE
jgi:hypothetical protein